MSFFEIDQLLIICVRPGSVWWVTWRTRRFRRLQDADIVGFGVNTSGVDVPGGVVVAMVGGIISTEVGGCVIMC